MTNLLRSLAALLIVAGCYTGEPGSQRLHVELDVVLGEDNGQPLGTLFELRAGGRLVAAAGVQQVNGTHLSNNGKVLSFFVTGDAGTTVNDIGDPFPGMHSHTRLFNWRNTLYAFTRAPFPAQVRRMGCDGHWHDAPELETALGAGVRNIEVVANELLVFHDNAITHGGDTIFSDTNILHLNGIYRNGQLLVHLFAGANGPNGIMLASWEPKGGSAVLPVAWYQDPAPVPAASFTYCNTSVDSAFLIGTNFGGLYRVDADSLETVFQRGTEDPSWQPYCFLTMHQDVLVGHYPSGRLLRYTQNGIGPHSPPIRTPQWAPERSREAQALCLYGGALFCGIWPWGEVHELDLSTMQWKDPFRLFSLPRIDPSIKIPEHWDAPYVDLFDAEQNGVYNNDWGQRVTGFTLMGNAMYASTSNKGLSPPSDVDMALLGQAVVTQYGRIHRIQRPGTLAA